jgi:hypothetical protein
MSAKDLIDRIHRDLDKIALRAEKMRRQCLPTSEIERRIEGLLPAEWTDHLPQCSSRGRRRGEVIREAHEPLAPCRCPRCGLRTAKTWIHRGARWYGCTGYCLTCAKCAMLEMAEQIAVVLWHGPLP